jgi:CheY-like chemotaxis protein
MRYEVISVGAKGCEVKNADGELARTLWLPAEEWSDTSADWDCALDWITPGEVLDLIELQGMTSDTGLGVVSRRMALTSLPVTSLLHREVLMEVESVGRNVVRGWVEGHRAGIDRSAYVEFLREKRIRESLHDHSVLSKGDLVSGLAVRIDSDGCLQIDPIPILRELEVHTAGQRPQTTGGNDNHMTRHLQTEEREGIPEALSRLRTVLLLEDDQNLRESLAALLRHDGLTVIESTDVTDAQAHMAQLDSRAAESPSSVQMDLAIIDVNLQSGSEDLQGLALAMKLAKETHWRILIMTGENGSENKVNLWGSVRVGGVLQKPFDLEELYDAMSTACTLSPIPLKQWILAEGKDDTTTCPVLAGPQPPHSSEDPESVIIAELRRLERYAQGSDIHVFAVHPRSFRARSLVHVGHQLQWEHLRGKIGKSPIKDVAVDRMAILETDVASDRRHLWTRQMMNYRSFCGTPIGGPPPEMYALVAFHRGANAFGGEY